MNARASVIVVNYNGKRFLKDCISAVLSQSHEHFELIVVDNGSTDGSVEYIHGNFRDERVRVIRSETNLGFAGGNNLGLKHCSGEFIVLLNNDTITHRSWLEELLRCMIENPEAGMAQSLVLTKGIPGEYYEMNGTINLLGHNIMRVFPIRENGIGEIVQANGCSLIIPRKLVDEFGGLFPDYYFAYAEDTFLSLRVLFSGRKILHNSRSVVEHFGGGSQGGNSLYFYQERNRLLNFLIFFGRGFRIRYTFYLVINFVMKSAAALFSPRYSISGLLNAYGWLLFNRQLIRQTRDSITPGRSRSEAEILSLLSGKLSDGTGMLSKALNTLSALYCRAAGIRVIETGEK